MFERPTTGSIVCPGCGRLVGVRDEKCFNCGRRNPGLWGFAPLLQKLGLNFGFTEIVVTSCAAMFVLSLLSDPQNIGMGSIFSMLSPSWPSLFLYGGSGAQPIFGFGRWWTVLSAAWLHGSLLHIVFNMYWLRQIMPMVDEYYGTGRLIIIYTAGSIGGFALTSSMFLLVQTGPFGGALRTIGASAPLFGLFGALIVYGNRTGQTEQSRVVWRYVAMFVVIGLVVPMIDNWGHLGGLAGGYLAARIMDPLKTESATHLLVGLACLALVALSIIASVLLGAPVLMRG